LFDVRIDAETETGPGQRLPVAGDGPRLEFFLRQHQAIAQQPAVVVLRVELIA
jgi:hypothetical protein